MPTVPTAKVVASGEGRTIMLFAVRFDWVTARLRRRPWPRSRSHPAPHAGQAPQPRP